jgi:hypothetical protein
LETGAAENRAMLNGRNSFNLGTRAANHAGITHAQMLAADDTDGTVYKAALVELLVAADCASAEKTMDIELIRRKGDIYMHGGSMRIALPHPRRVKNNKTCWYGLAYNYATTRSSTYIYYPQSP